MLAAATEGNFFKDAPAHGCAPTCTLAMFRCLSEFKKKCAGSKNNGVYGRSWTEGVGTGFEPMEFLNPILDL